MGTPRSDAQLLKGTLALLVLATLRDGELHGYEIVRRIRVRSGGALAPSEGSLYPTLHRLETEGVLAATWRVGEGGPRRRYYRLTDAGVAALARAEQEWQTFVGSVSRVAFGAAADG